MDTIYSVFLLLIVSITLISEVSQTVTAQNVAAPKMNFSCGKRGQIAIQFFGQPFRFPTNGAILSGPRLTGPPIANLPRLPFKPIVTKFNLTDFKIKPELTLSSRSKRSEERVDSRLKRSLKPGIQLSKPPKKFEDIPGVVGGFESYRNSWPWMALLWQYRDSKKNYFCSSILINEQFVLTAAHCILSTDPIYVRLGEHNVNDRTPTSTRDFNITDYIFHPLYNVKLGYFDQALLKLDRRVQFSNIMRPVCLPWGNKAKEDIIGKQVKVTGWGSSNFGGTQSSFLQEVSLNVFPTSECEKAFQTLPGYRREFPNGMTPENMLCAGDKRGGKDACDGDSGGPLVKQNRDGTYTLFGTVSKGYGCGKPDFPGLYAPLTNSKTLQWIKEIAF